MIFTTRNFLIGVAVGAVAVALIKTNAGRKCCAKVVAAGLQLKDEASELFETIKEDAEDVAAEKSAKKVKKA